VPPAGIAAQLDFFGGGGGIWCLPKKDGVLALELTVKDPPYVPGDFIFFCPHGFGDAMPTITITTPGGSQVELPNATAPFRIPADFGPGQYTLAASLDDRTTSVVFDVLSVRSPRAIVEPSFGAPGTTFTVAVLGLAPQQEVALQLYQLVHDAAEPSFMGWTYVTTLPVIVADPAGRATLTLPTQIDDPVGLFRLSGPPEWRS
jgi:hypothetical protein